ncbi:MAG: hypothetical protein ACI9ES_002390, partial [Oceanospirillaceae bacterium]
MSLAINPLLILLFYVPTEFPSCGQRIIKLAPPDGE